MSNQIQKQNIEINEASVVALILAIFLPPIGVLIKKGVGLSFLINIFLTLLGFVPGIIHALYVILVDKEN